MKKPSQIYYKNFTRQSHRYKAATSSSDNDLEISLNNRISNDDDEILEACNLSYDDIGKVTPFSWLADTGASSHMSDQPSIFRRIIFIIHRWIQVRGEVLYSDTKETVDLTCNDHLLIVLKNTFYVPKLGTNLLSARYLYEVGLVRSFNSSIMYFKLNRKTIIKVKIENGLYIVNHVSKTYKEIAFSSIDYNISDSNDQQSPIDELLKPTGTLNQSAKDRYFLFH
jgi:hypothetical protein